MLYNIEGEDRAKTVDSNSKKSEKYYQNESVLKSFKNIYFLFVYVSVYNYKDLFSAYECVCMNICI